MARYEAAVADGTVYVHAATDRIEVGDVDTILDLVGGPAWTVSYTDREKERYPPHVTADEGITVDVADAINDMTVGEGFVETLAAQPADPVARADVATSRQPDGATDATGDDGATDATGDDGATDDTADTPEGGPGPANAEPISPRLGLFVGRLLENLEYGIR